MTTPTLPRTDTIDVHQFTRMRAADPDIRVLDVRTGGEFETVHIPGSYNVPLDTLGEHTRDLAAVDHPVVLVCKSGGRASQAHQKLTSAGKETLHILEGGMDAWLEIDGEVVLGDTTRWSLERQVRFAAGAIALTGLALSTIMPQAKWLAGGVAAGLTFSAATNTCAMGVVLAKLPYNQTNACDIQGVLAELNRTESPVAA